MRIRLIQKHYGIYYDKGILGVALDKNEIIADCIIAHSIEQACRYFHWIYNLPDSLTVEQMIKDKIVFEMETPNWKGSNKL